MGSKPLINAIHPECQKCVSNRDGECIALNSTNFNGKECPFVATPERLIRDWEILQIAIKMGHVKL